MDLFMVLVYQLGGLVRSLVRREEGQALAEYGLILALIALVAIAALTALGLQISGKLTAVTNAFGV